jgi:hypothetical protein
LPVVASGEQKTFLSTKQELASPSNSFDDLSRQSNMLRFKQIQEKSAKKRRKSDDKTFYMILIDFLCVMSFGAM